MACFSLEFNTEERLSLPVVRISAKTVLEHQDIENEAILIIPGGPGQGMSTAQESVDYYAQWMLEHQIPFDIVLMESRGNRLSSINWDCDDYERESRKMLARNMSMIDEYSQLADISHECIDQYDAFLHKAGIPQGVKAISTAANAEDIEALTAALDYDGWHLLGTSYGTRLALYAAENPKVKTLVLDSPYPFDKGTLFDWPKLLENTFAIHELKFQSYFDTEESYLDYFKHVSEQLEKKTLSFNLELWDDSGFMPFVLNAQRLQALHFFVLYDETLLDIYYSALVSLKEDDEDDEDMRWVLESFVSNTFDKDFNSMVFFATECNDNALVGLDLFKQQVDTINSEVKAMVGEENLISEWDFDVCHHSLFDNSDRIQGREYKDTPSLIFSGEIDPVTPPDWARSLAGGLTNAALVEVPEIGHAVLSTEVCDISNLIQFWKTKDPKTPIDCTLEPGNDELD